jgi:hypothetical protein
MKKFLIMALLLSIAIYFLTQDSLTIEYNQLFYHIPILYPGLAIGWIFFAGMALGVQWSAWERYRLRHHIRYYQLCAKEAEKRLDEARWIVCEIVSDRPLLRLTEIAEDYVATMGQQGEALSNMRKGDSKINFSGNRLIEQAIQEESYIQEALQSRDSIDALHSLQKLSWDCWTNVRIIQYVLKYWDIWSDPVRMWLISKIMPMYWSEYDQEVLLKMIRTDENPARWIGLLKKQQWFEKSNQSKRIIQDLLRLGH